MKLTRLLSSVDVKSPSRKWTWFTEAPGSNESRFEITRLLWSAVHGPAVLGQLPDVTPGSEADPLAAVVLDLSLAGLESGALLDRIAHRPNCE